MVRDEHAPNELLTISPLSFLMSNYHRPRVPGSTIFFTVTLADRRSDLLVREIDHQEFLFRLDVSAYARCVVIQVLY